MTTNVETYFDSLSDDILTLDISGKGIKYLPDLKIYKNYIVLVIN